MKEYRLTGAEERLADIIWINEPLPSRELVKLCEEKLNWKKSTTYTMLKRLENKKLFRNKDSIVSSKVKRDEFFAGQSKQFVEETFGGSLPRFLAAFAKGKRLSEKEIDGLQRLIDEHREE